jgi:ketosteroid isomerase-like protein
MSLENVEGAQWIGNMRRAIDAWNREDLDAFLETWHPDCEWRPAFPRSLEGVGTIYRGRDGIARAWRGVRAVWEEYRLSPEDARVVGDKLVAVGRVSARGKESGVELDSGWSALATFRDGLAITAWDWLDRDEALTAAGLREEAMSQENVETMRLAYERLNSDDIDGFLQLCATDFEMHDLPALPGAGVHVGHDAARTWWGQMCQTFDDLRFEPDEMIHAGGGRVVVVCRAVGRGKVSGADLDLLTFNVWTVSNGAIVSCMTYNEHAQALEAVGLRE